MQRFFESHPRIGGLIWIVFCSLVLLLYRDAHPTKNLTSFVMAVLLVLCILNGLVKVIAGSGDPRLSDSETGKMLPGPRDSVAYIVVGLVLLIGRIYNPSDEVFIAVEFGVIAI